VVRQEVTELPSRHHRQARQYVLQIGPRLNPQTIWQTFWRTTVDDQPSLSVAAELGISANGVRMAKSRVLHCLREELGDLIE
jgi:hypothetical protein